MVIRRGKRRRTLGPKSAVKTIALNSSTNSVTPSSATVNNHQKGKSSELVLAVQDLEAAIPPEDFQLTSQIRGAVLMLRKMKYLSQRKRMKHAMKPYDVLDIVESYSAGHNDLVATVKM